MTSVEVDLSNRTEFGIQDDRLRYAWAGYNIFILLSSLIGDSIILVASSRYDAFKIHRFVVVVIQHIAICDLMVSVVSVFSRVVSLLANDWVLGNVWKYVAAYGIYYFNGVGLLLISVMTSSKLFLMKFPFRGRTLSTKAGQVSCFSMWAFALVYVIIIMAVDGDDVLFDHRTYDCRLGWSAPIWRRIKPVIVGVYTLIPLMVVVGTTTALLNIARNFAKGRGDSIKWQGMITTILVAVVYCVSILPYTVYTFIGYSGAQFADDPHSFFRTHYNRIVKSFIFINTISNFYIYSLTVESFREFLRTSRLNVFRWGSSANEFTRMSMQNVSSRSTSSRFISWGGSRRSTPINANDK